MKNYTQRGDTLTIAAPYAVASGDGVQVGAIFGVAAETAAEGALVDITAVGCFALEKVGANVVAVGQPVFWDDDAKLITTAEADNLLVGVAIAASVSGAATATIRLNGTFGL